jgi:hypothetical protein
MPLSSFPDYLSFWIFLSLVALSPSLGIKNGLPLGFAANLKAFLSPVEDVC